MKRLTREQRYTISVMHPTHTMQQIANCIGVDKSTISREISRNCDLRNGRYRADLAQKKTEQRQKEKPHYRSLTDDVKRTVIKLIKLDWSPEQIAGKLKEDGGRTVSHETIYKLIYDDKSNGGELYLHLRRHQKKYKKRSVGKDKRGQIKNRVSIDERPDIVDKKVRFGDCEIDTIIGKNHKGALLTINDRVTGFVWIRLLEDKQAKTLAQAAVEALKGIKEHLYTITADNGKEFSDHQTISKELGVDVYYAHPYHSWERGANENTNGLIRQYFPKGSSFDNITPEMVAEVQQKLNSRPRKRLNYKTPLEMMKLKLNDKDVALAA